MYFVFLILALIATLLNPYVGLFGLLVIVEILVYAGFGIYIEKTEGFADLFGDISEKKYLNNVQKSGKVVMKIWCVAAVFFWICSTFISLVVWLFASGVIGSDGRHMTPWIVFEPKNEFSGSVKMLLAAVIMQTCAVVWVFWKKKQMEKPRQLDNFVQREKERYEGLKECIPQIDIHIGMLPIFCVILAMIFGMANPYLGWISLLIHFLYLLLIGALKLMVVVSAKISKMDSRAMLNARYLLAHLLRGSAYNEKILATIWVITGLSCGGQMLLTFKAKNDMFAVFGLDMGMAALVLSCGFEILTALFLSKAVLGIGVKE